MTKRLRFFSMEVNRHGPSLVPCGTPTGTGPYSKKHSDANLIRWDLSDKESIIQLIMLAGNLHWLRNFLTSILWSIKSSALRQSNNNVLTVAPFPSVPKDQLCSILISAIEVEEFGMAPYWLSLRIMTVDFTKPSTTNSSATLEIQGSGGQLGTTKKGKKKHCRTKFSSVSVLFHCVLCKGEHFSSLDHQSNINPHNKQQL